MDKEELRIVELLREGDERAYRYLYEEHYAILCEIASRLLHDDFLAETVVGDVFFHIWEIRQDLEIRTSIRSYLARSVRNRCLNYLTSPSVRSTTTLEEDPVDGLRDPGFPLGRLLYSELEGEIGKAVGRLPEETRRVFRMHRFEGKKYQEIATELGISVNTVKYHIKRALSSLRTDLGRYLLLSLLVLPSAFL
ncbi:MAG: RNA polymerase sigma-70 factor [Bacteroidales bacterium]|nr:RNA polymerase sigma-70 factor [Bacteroidales bacterium]